MNFECPSHISSYNSCPDLLEDESTGNPINAQFAEQDNIFLPEDGSGIEWTQTISGSNFGHRPAEIGCNVFASYFSGQFGPGIGISLGGTNFNNAFTQRDAFIARIEPTSGAYFRSSDNMQEFKLSEASLSVYPNPSKGQFVLELEEQVSKLSLEILVQAA